MVQFFILGKYIPCVLFPMTFWKNCSKAKQLTKNYVFCDRNNNFANKYKC